VNRIAIPLLLAASAFAQSGVIEIYPGPSTVEIGATRLLSKYVSVSPGTLVWTVNGVVGGNATYGTINASLLYTAPPVPPPNYVIEIRATSAAYPGIFGKAILSIVQPVPNVWGSSPSTAPTGSPLYSPSVFNFFSPMYHVVGNPLFGPELRIYSPTESVQRANLTYQILVNQMGSSWTVNLATFLAVAGIASALITAMAPGVANIQRMIRALYLTALSRQYVLQHQTGRFRTSNGPGMHNSAVLASLSGDRSVTVDDLSWRAPLAQAGR
jgi:hypothetical protein